MQAASSLSLRWMLGEGSLEGFLADSEVNGGGENCGAGAGAYSWVSRCRLFSVGPACRWGRLSGVVGPDVSKTEGIKASVAWVSSRDHAMGWCFWRVFGVPSVLHCMVSGLISSVLDTWRVHCAVPAPESGPPRSGPGWGGALEGAWALSWTRGCATNAVSGPITRAGALIIRDEASVESGSLR